MPKNFLLHICCAPCAGQVMQELKQRGFEITAYFCNPNIYPSAEHKVRRDEIKKYCLANKINFIEEKYKHMDWLNKVRGLEKEPEGGQRCAVCYQQRLELTAKFAQAKGFDVFDSTLSISPHKDFEKIRKIGDELAEKYDTQYYGGNWKKKDGFKKACCLAREHGFYRQSYCGCEFSQQH